MVAPRILDGEQLRARAEECRAIADMFHGAQTRERMLRVAADYERMATTADLFESDIEELRHRTEHVGEAPPPGAERG